MPPRRGIGFRWTLRGPGLSTMPKRSAKWRMGTVRPSDAASAMANTTASVRIDISTLSPLQDTIPTPTAETLFIALQGPSGYLRRYARSHEPALRLLQQQQSGST